jgi:hypothetical protein
MAGLEWFELDVDFHDDPKIRALASRLRQPLADAYVSRLYAYAYKHATDRFDPSVASDTIEDACGWKGRRGVLFDALFAVEVLEREGGKVVVHGVAARLGPHLAHRQAATERQRRRRDKAAKFIGQDARVTRDVTPSVTAQNASVTRESQPDRDRDSNKIGSVGERDSCSAPPALSLADVRAIGASDGERIRGGAPDQEALWAEKWPRLAAVVAAVRATGCPADWPKAATQRAAADLAVGDQDPIAVAQRVAVAIAETGKPWLGWHVDAIRGAAPPGAKPKRGGATYSTDWTSEEATRL